MTPGRSHASIRRFSALNGAIAEVIEIDLGNLLRW